MMHYNFEQNFHKYFWKPR